MEKNSDYAKKLLNKEEGYWVDLEIESVYKDKEGRPVADKIRMKKQTYGDQQIILTDEMAYLENKDEAVVVVHSFNTIFWIQEAPEKQSMKLLALRDTVSQDYFEHAFPISSKQIVVDGESLFELTVGLKNDYKKKSGISHINYVLDYENKKMKSVEIIYQKDLNLISQKKTIYQEARGKEFKIQENIRAMVLSKSGKPLGEYRGMNVEIIANK